MKERIKNPYFWTALIGAVALACGIELESLTSWGAFLAEIKEAFLNPVSVIASIMVIIGIFVDPTTGGLKDGESEVIYTKEEEA